MKLFGTLYVSCEAVALLGRMTQFDLSVVTRRKTSINRSIDCYCLLFTILHHLLHLPGTVTQIDMSRRFDVLKHRSISQSINQSMYLLSYIYLSTYPKIIVAISRLKFCFKIQSTRFIYYRNLKSALLDVCRIAITPLNSGHVHSNFNNFLNLHLLSLDVFVDATCVDV